MSDSIWNKRIPSLLGIFILVAGIGLTSFLTQSSTLLQSKAGASSTPSNIQITNIADSSFTVSYLTSQKASGTISYGPTESLGIVAFDDKNPQGAASESVSHHITVKNLKPLTKYFFVITSRAQTYYNNDKPFEITTAQQLSQVPSKEITIKGTVSFDASSAEGGIVYINIEQSQLLSTVLNTKGSYELVTKTLRTEDLSTAQTPKENTPVTVTIVSSDTQSKLNLRFDQLAGIPKVALPGNYDFTHQPTPTPFSETESRFPSFLKKSKPSPSR